ncbi:hypothetical protein CLAIMM_12817, partial [Cladophialophora immunda]
MVLSFQAVRRPHLITARGRVAFEQRAFWQLLPGFHNTTTKLAPLETSFGEL